MRRVACVVALAVIATLSYSPVAQSATKTPSFKLGQAFIFENSQNYLLFDLRVDKVFGLNGKPVKAKVQQFCGVIYLTTAITNIRRDTNIKEWSAGCVSALMSLTYTRQ